MSQTRSRASTRASTRASARAQESPPKSTDDLPLYMVLGHGNEFIEDTIEDRFTLPKNTYVVLLTTAGTSVKANTMKKYLELYENKDDIHRLHHPIQNAKYIEDHLNANPGTSNPELEYISVRVYEPGCKIPNIKTDLTTLWNYNMESGRCNQYHHTPTMSTDFLDSTSKIKKSYVCVEFMKSGIHKIPPGTVMDPSENKLNLSSLKTLKERIQQHIFANLENQYLESEFGYSYPNDETIARFFLYNRNSDKNEETAQNINENVKSFFSVITEIMFEESLINPPTIPIKLHKNYKSTIIDPDDPTKNTKVERIYNGYEYLPPFHFTIEEIVKKYGEGIYYFDGCRYEKTIHDIDKHLKLIYGLLREYLHNVIIELPDPNDFNNFEFKPAFITEYQNGIQAIISVPGININELKIDLNLSEFKKNISIAHLSNPKAYLHTYIRIIGSLLQVLFFIFKYYFVYKINAPARIPVILRDGNTSHIIYELVQEWKKYKAYKDANKEKFENIIEMGYESDAQQKQIKNAELLRQVNLFKQMRQQQKSAKACQSSLICEEILSSAEAESLMSSDSPDSPDSPSPSSCKKQRTSGGKRRNIKKRS